MLKVGIFKDKNSEQTKNKSMLNKALKKVEEYHRKF